MCETELHQMLLKYEIQAFQNTTIWAQQACQNVLPESQVLSGFSTDSKAGYYTNLLFTVLDTIGTSLRYITVLDRC